MAEGRTLQRNQFPNVALITFLSGDTSMIRRRLLIVTSVIASIVLAACSDMTAPKSDTCPVVGGSSTCVGH
jgi:hypothetical protein